MVNRPDLRISARTALLAVTRTAAEILGISNKAVIIEQSGCYISINYGCDTPHLIMTGPQVGSIQVGLEANLVILSRNPLAVPPVEIKDVQVLTTIFRGLETKI